MVLGMLMLAVLTQWWGASSISLPSGAILMFAASIATNACPPGTTPWIVGDGRMPLFTTLGGSNVGTVGGSDTMTPTGTVTAPVFTGSALATHAHELPWQIPSTTTIRQIAVATFGTGTSRAATAVSAAGTANVTNAAVALSQAISAGTPAGTNSVPVFTGASFDNRPAYIRVLACRVN